MALSGELAKYVGKELVKSSGKELAKAGARSALSSLVPSVATKIGTDIASKAGAELATKSALSSLTPVRSNWVGEGDIEGMLNGKFLGANQDYFDNTFSRGALGRATYGPEQALDRNKVAGLVRAIKNNEDIAPIAGFKNDEGLIDIFDGHHRLAAYQKAGKMPRVKLFDKATKDDAYAFADDWSKNAVKKVKKYIPAKPETGLDEYGIGKVDLSSINESKKIPEVQQSEIGLSPQQQEFFKDSIVRNDKGDLKVLYHGSPKGEFYEFNKELANPESDWGKGFYFTDNELDVKNNYVGGGPDFDNKIERRADQIQDELDIPYADAIEKAREELYKGDYRISAYANMKDPAIVGKTILFDGSEYDVKPLEGYDNIDDYYNDLIYDLSDDAISDTNIDYAYKDDLMRIMSEAYYDGGIGLQELKDKLNELYIEDYDGNLVGNDVARSIIENLGFDGIIDPTVSSKFNMDIEDGTTHYIMFNPEQVKNIGNRAPTKSKDIRYAIAAALGIGSIIGPYMNSQKSVDNIE